MDKGTTPHEIAFDSCWASICTIADKEGAAPLNKFPGIWTFEAEKWKVSMNGSGREGG